MSRIYNGQMVSDEDYAAWTAISSSDPSEEHIVEDEFAAVLADAFDTEPDADADPDTAIADALAGADAPVADAPVADAPVADAPVADAPLFPEFADPAVGAV